MANQIAVAVLVLGGAWCLAGLAASPTQPATSRPAAAASTPPRTLLLDGASLVTTRRATLAGDPALADAMRQVRHAADRYMAKELCTVTGKPFAGPSGDKHDYVSLAPDWWPDPKSPNGLPYVWVDSVINPEAREYDRYRLRPMVNAVEKLAIGYYLTGQEPYARRAAEQLRAWFLDPQTKMNPHLQYGQMRKGANEGTATGICESADFVRVVDAAAILALSPAWPAEDHKRLQEWFDQYLQWLLTSEHGKREGRGPQNHATYFDLQVADYALFVGKKDLAREILENVKTKRIAKQIEPDGSQPRELTRATALSYSNLNLTGMFHLARLGEHVDVDLWNYRTADGRSIRRALDWMVPYATGEKPWDYKQIKNPTHYAPVVYLLHQAANAYQDPAYEQALSKMKAVDGAKRWANLLYPLRHRPAHPRPGNTP